MPLYPSLVDGARLCLKKERRKGRRKEGRKEGSPEKLKRTLGILEKVKN